MRMHHVPVAYGLAYRTRKEGLVAHAKQGTFRSCLAMSRCSRLSRPCTVESSVNAVVATDEA
jgi:hypothetical protein